MKNKNTMILKDQVKIFILVLTALISILALSGCSKTHNNNPILAENQKDAGNTDKKTTDPVSGAAQNTEDANNTIPVTPELETIANNVFTFIDKTGMNTATRIHSPKDYVRIPSVPEELTGFLRGLPLKTDGSDILLYDGTPKGDQGNHIAVYNLDTGNRDLQQCADSILRIYAEYYWSIGSFEKIAFHLTNGFLMEYTKWRDGNRLVVDGNVTSWSKTKEYDDSYETFRSYLNKVFTYAGTLSLSGECQSVTVEAIRPGDMFLQGGSPGHCVLVVDIAEDANGNRCYLLAQGFMPAQEFHILKNPLHPEDPWYYQSEISFPLKTPSWTFDEGSLVRWGDFPLNKAGSPLNFTLDSKISDKNNVVSIVIPAMSDDLQVAGTGATGNTASGITSSQVTLLAVGDNLIHSEVIKSGKQKDGSYNYNHLYSNLKEEISTADIAVANQETILGGSEFPYSGYPNFNSPTEIGDALAQAGFDVILHATNHTMDKGLKAVENTFDFWKQYPEITVLGINESAKEQATIPIIEKNGIKLAMLNYTYSLNGYHLPKNMPYLVNMLDRKKMEEDIKKAEEEADFTIVFPHWGTEYIYQPSKAQKDLVNFFYDLGVDLVIGSHPHVLEPVEWVEKEENHRMLVYYSLGNFISYQKEAPRMLGGMANITITKDATGTYISDSEITPIVTHYEPGSTDYHYGIYKLSDYTEALAELHGVTKISQQGPLTYENTDNLAKQILGYWYQ
jgi:poly-gamma-glutamate capsule biosynthesis protein CapA/YwtB (metallophosphatase superfamily)